MDTLISKTRSSTYFPPEWAPQSGIMLTWPNATNVWHPSLAEVEQQFVPLAKEIAKRQICLISVLNEAQVDPVKALLTQGGVNLSRVRIYAVPSNDVWARDHGPITVLKEGKPTLLDFQFNAWGNKYEGSDDNWVTRRLQGLGAFAAPVESLNFILEGGSIETDGQGTLLTTERCLSTERNTHLQSDQIATKLREYLGIERILWLKHGGLAGDDTDGHIDTLVRFTDPHTLCYVQCDDPKDEHYEELAAMEAQLRTWRDTQDQPYRLVPLPWPQGKYSAEGQRLPATYANFLIINGAVLVPTYDDPADKRALAQIQVCFPEREVVGVPCRHIIEQYGSLHCVTMQLPVGVLKT